MKLSQATIESYRERGFVHLPGVLDPGEVARFRAAVERLRQQTSSPGSGQVFAQYVDVWQQDATLAELSCHPRLAGVAEQLAGIPVRLWHDQVLVKEPHNKAATEFHQDAPYWPHGNCRHALSAWIALVDVPAERGCMTFIPGSQERTDLEPQDLRDRDSLTAMWPEVAWRERVTVPLRAGDCTFHNAYTAHTANANDTAVPRVAHVVIYMDILTTYTGMSHPVTDPLNLAVNQQFPDERFPRPAQEEPGPGGSGGA